MEAGREAVQYERAITAELEQDAARKFKDGGIKIHQLTDEQRKEFKSLTKPVWDKFSDTIPKELIELVQNTQK